MTANRAVFERFATSFVPDPEVINLSLSQPENLTPPGPYLTAVVTAERVAPVLK